MPLIATPLYAAVLTGLFLVLSVRALRARRAAKVALGGDDPALLRAVRVQANFAEYAPLGLVLLLIAEVQAAPALLLHAVGLILVVGRAVHAYGVSREPEDFRFRVRGMQLTLAALSLGALLGLAMAGAALLAQGMID